MHACMQCLRLRASERRCRHAAHARRPPAAVLPHRRHPRQHALDPRGVRLHSITAYSNIDTLKGRVRHPPLQPLDDSRRPCPLLPSRRLGSHPTLASHAHRPLSACCPLSSSSSTAVMSSWLRALVGVPLPPAVRLPRVLVRVSERAGCSPRQRRKVGNTPRRLAGRAWGGRTTGRQGQPEAEASGELAGGKALATAAGCDAATPYSQPAGVSSPSNPCPSPSLNKPPTHTCPAHTPIHHHHHHTRKCTPPGRLTAASASPAACP